jgi:hypothetical protein
MEAVGGQAAVKEAGAGQESGVMIQGAGAVMAR